MNTPRYAIYIAPPLDQPLWGFGSKVLGYDASNGRDIRGFAPPGMTPLEWSKSTARPRQYGFHATLKAPFRLAAQTSFAELDSALNEYADATSAFDLGPLVVTAISSDEDQGFVALTQSRPSPELKALEQQTVSVFDRFRAPLTPEEWEKRKPDGLTERQKKALLEFGYPFTGPDYQFHMTLSAQIPDVASVADQLADVLANDIGAAHLAVDALVLFAQESPSERFRILKRYDLLKQTKLSSGHALRDDDSRPIQQTAC